MSDTETPHLEDSQVSHICMTLDDFRDKEGTFANCREVVAELAKEGRCDTISGFGQRYRARHRLIRDKRNTIILQFDPLQQNKDAPMRIDLSPDVSGSGIQTTSQTLRSLLLDDFQPAMASARISEITVVVDASNTRVRDLFFYDRNKRKSQVYYGDDGEPYRVRLGAAKSDLTFDIRDVDNKRLIRTTPDAVPTVRIALTMIGQGLSWSDIIENNPFMSLHVWDCPSSDAKASLTWRLFLEACRRCGAPAALRMIGDDHKRNLFRNRLQTRQNASWWHPDRLWAPLPRLLRDNGFYCYRLPRPATLPLSTGVTQADQLHRLSVL